MSEAEPWPGRPMRETVHTIAAEYRRGDRVRLKTSPDPGTVSETRCHDGRIQHRVGWDHVAHDYGWYDESEIERYCNGDG
jgi:hypothetical protein